LEPGGCRAISPRSLHPSNELPEFPISAYRALTGTEIELLGVDEKKTTALAIIAQTEHALLEDVSASAQFMKFIKRENEWLPIDPPASAVLAWQARASRLRLPLLSAAISTPLILPTGRIIEKPGYDEGTGFFLQSARRCLPADPQQANARRCPRGAESFSGPHQGIPVRRRRLQGCRPERHSDQRGPPRS
jgi:hypothetical protein